MKMELAQANSHNKQLDATIDDLNCEGESLRRELNESRTQYRECAQELAHHEEKLSLMEKSFQTTQEELSQRVTEVVRHEQNIRKLQVSQIFGLQRIHIVPLKTI